MSISVHQRPINRKCPPKTPRQYGFQKNPRKRKVFRKFGMKLWYTELESGEFSGRYDFRSFSAYYFAADYTDFIDLIGVIYEIRGYNLSNLRRSKLVCGRRSATGGSQTCREHPPGAQKSISPESRYRDATSNS